MEQTLKEILGAVVGFLFIYKYFPAIKMHYKAEKIRGVSISEKTTSIIALTLQAVILTYTGVWTLAISSIVALCLDCVILYYRVKKGKESSRGLIYKLIFR